MRSPRRSHTAGSFWSNPGCKAALPDAKEPGLRGPGQSHRCRRVVRQQCAHGHACQHGRQVLLGFLASRFIPAAVRTASFSKTIAAGLATANGISGSTVRDCCATMRACSGASANAQICIDLIRHAGHDPGLVEYAIATVFGDPRPAGSYESRAAAMPRTSWMASPQRLLSAFFGRFWS